MFLGIHFRFPKKYFPLGSYYRFPTVPRIPIVFSGKTKIVNGRKIWKNETFLSPGTLTNCPICMKARLMAVYKLCRLCRGGGNTPKVDLLNKPYILNKEDDKDRREEGPKLLILRRHSLWTTPCQVRLQQISSESDSEAGEKFWW